MFALSREASHSGLNAASLRRRIGRERTLSLDLLDPPSRKQLADRYWPPPSPSVPLLEDGFSASRRVIAGCILSSLRPIASVFSAVPWTTCPRPKPKLFPTPVLHTAGGDSLAARPERPGAAGPEPKCTRNTLRSPTLDILCRFRAGSNHCLIPLVGRLNLLRHLIPVSDGRRGQILGCVTRRETSLRYMAFACAGRLSLFARRTYVEIPRGLNVPRALQLPEAPVRIFGEVVAETCPLGLVAVADRLVQAHLCRIRARWRHQWRRGTRA